MTFEQIKALHLIFVVTWFAGLFYIVRLFVYHAEANLKNEPEKQILQNQYKIMEKRLWFGIAWPSMIGTLIFGFWLLIERPFWLEDLWMQLKLLFVAGLLIYHFICHRIVKDLSKDIVKHSSQKMRLWNEVATLFLVSIVFLVVCKRTMDFVYGLIGLVAFTAVLLIAIKIYKRLREKTD